MEVKAYIVHLKRCNGNKCLTCRDGTINITVPKFESISKTLSSLNHQEFNLQLISPYCPACGRRIKKKKTGTK